MNKPPLFECYNKCIYVNYKRTFLNNGIIRGWGFDYFGFGIGNKMFDSGYFYQDGIKLQGYTFLFFNVVYGYHFDSEEIEG